MVSTQFIQEGAESMYCPEEYVEFIGYLKEATDEFDHILYSIDLDKDQNSLKAIFGESAENEGEVFTEDGKIKQAITALGEFIKKIIQKVLDTIKSIGKKITDITFRLKSVEKKMDVLLKNHPELKDEKAFLYDNIRLSDVKSINELEKEYKQCIALIEARENPKSIRAKWNKAWQKYINNSGGAINGGLKVAKDVAIAVTAITSIATLGTMIRKAQARANRPREVQDQFDRGANRVVQKIGDDLSVTFESKSTNEITPELATELISTMKEMYSMMQRAEMEDATVGAKIVNSALADTSAFINSHGGASLEVK